MVSYFNFLSTGAPRMHASFRTFFLIAGLAFALSGCAETELASHWAKQIAGTDAQSGVYKIGNPYKVGSVWYYPKENFKLVETGIASWYGPGFHAGKTANGEVFDQDELTAAHRTLQLPSLARVTNLENGRSIVVRVNDRGPFKSSRVMDVSRRAADLLGFLNKGTARVRIEVLEQESRQLADAAKRGEDTTRMTASDFQRNAQVASAAPAPAQDDSVPESLRTPTITVEELNANGKAVTSEELPPPSTASGPVEGHVAQGRFLPSPVVTTEPVKPTGIFVQAGSFGVYDNAERLSKNLVGIAPTSIETVSVGGRTMYRVRLGPISSVDAADAVLDKVIRAGQGGARVIHDKKKV